MKRITKAALGGLAGCALVLGGAQAAVAAYELWPYGGDVIDIVPVEGPFDAASLTLQVKQSGDGTNFVLDVTDIDATAAGKEFGAHLHTDKCDDETATNGSLAGPHYNHELLGLNPPVPVGEEEISRRTEVWFDLVPSVDGVDAVARDSTTVKFVPVDPDGVMSIVIHVADTNHKTGLAGGRGVCFPLDAREWTLKAPPEAL